jgi:hypothetical protein
MKKKKNFKKKKLARTLPVLNKILEKKKFFFYTNK